MNEHHISEEYEKGFMFQYVQEHAISMNETYFCHCIRCLNQIHQDLGTLCDHLFIFGIEKNYTIWTWHGEVLHKPTTSRGKDYMKEWMNEHLEDMVCEVGEQNSRITHLYASLKFDSKEELYLRCSKFTPRCANFTRQSTTLKLFNLKARNEWIKKFHRIIGIVEEYAFRK
ncbi:hypothetical protein V8G54_019565 [Vigna mungo]|uniref:Transposase-associated domain-containing protein n=1 Tax=Vigna mungo TaxID=3915 RepID=A0AAQ3RSJ0_VIGMU